MESSAQAVIGGGASGDGKEMENQRKGGGRVDQSETEKKDQQGTAGWAALCK